MNYFEFFQLPVSFHLDTGLLRKRFLDNTKQLHPDVNQNLTEELAQEKTAYNNTAYSTLADEDKRAKYILDELCAGTEKAQLPADFLADMMEVNEDLMEAKMEGNVEAIQNIADRMMADQNNLIAEIETSKSMFDKGNTAAINDLRVLFLKRNYLNRILEQL